MNVMKVRNKHSFMKNEVVKPTSTIAVVKSTDGKNTSLK